jgi:hypothetical protein
VRIESVPRALRCLQQLECHRQPRGSRAGPLGHSCAELHRERKVSSDWTCEEDALKVLSERQQQIRAGEADRSVSVTLGAVVERYLTFKADHGKRSLHEDKRILEKQILPAFGGGSYFGNSRRKRLHSMRSNASKKSARGRCGMS